MAGWALASVASALVAVALLAGCIAPTASVEEVEGSFSQPADPVMAPAVGGGGAFEPEFDLAPPRIVVADAEGTPVAATLAGVPVSLSVEFPASAAVEEDKLAAIVWSLGDRVALAGAPVVFAFDEAGSHPVSVTVQDVYGRSVTASIDVTVR